MAQAIEDTRHKFARPSRIRGPHLRVFAREADGIPFRKAIARANRRDLVFASYKRLGGAPGSRGKEGLGGEFPCWSGTMSAYAEPGIPFNKSRFFSPSERALAYTDPADKRVWLFPIPIALLGEKDAILILEHPNYSLVEDDKEVFVHPLDASLIACISAFAQKEGWYFREEGHRIPCGEEIGYTYFNMGTSYIHRLEARVGPVACGGLCVGSNPKRYADFCCNPSTPLGILVESP